MEPIAARADVTRYRRRDIGEAELALIRDKIAEVGGQAGGRKAIAAAICEAWDWRQPRGTFAVRACGDLLLRLAEWGHIELPPAQTRRSGAPLHRRHPLLPQELIPLPWLEIRDPDADLGTLVVRPITDEEREGWQVYMERYHYLGCRPIVGEHLLYAAYLGEELVGLLGWGSAAFRAPLREAYLGWDESMKRERLQLVASNVRFLVLPWVRVRHLASKILATNLRRLSSDWEQKWGHPIHLAETFVDPRFRGTCYRASNWTYLGQTAGRAKRGNAYLKGSSKALFVYPLHRRARQLLGGGKIAAVVPPVAGEPSLRGKQLDPWLTPASTASASEASPETGSAVAIAAGIVAVSPSPTDSVAQNDDDHDRSVKNAPAIASITAGGAEEPAKDSALIGAVAALARSGDQPQHATRGRGGTNSSPLHIELTQAERSVLERQARGLAVPYRTVIRAKTILLLAAGETISAVARALHCRRMSVRKWAERFRRKRLDGLQDLDRSGRPARFSPGSRSSPHQAGL